MYKAILWKKKKKINPTSTFQAEAGLLVFVTADITTYSQLGFEWYYSHRGCGGGTGFQRISCTFPSVKPNLISPPLRQLKILMGAIGATMP